MILYPTETIYALGVNALDGRAVAELEAFKGRGTGKSLSWLVRDVTDIERWGVVSETAAKIAARFLPGSLTLVLPAQDSVPRRLRGVGDTVSFRISPDPVAQQLIAEFMAEHDAPLTCTSANVSGLPPQPTVELIRQQFEERGRNFSTVNCTIDDGPRSGVPSTVARIIDDQIEILREGAIPTNAILETIE